jgi:hypothetical protein
MERPEAGIATPRAEAPEGAIPVGSFITTVCGEVGLILGNCGHPWYWVKLENPWVPRFNPTGLHIGSFVEVEYA